MAADTVTLEPDGFEIAADDPLRAAHERLSAYLSEGRAGRRTAWTFDPKSLTAGAALFELPKPDQADLIAAALTRWRHATAAEPYPSERSDPQPEAEPAMPEDWVRQRRREFEEAAAALAEGDGITRWDAKETLRADEFLDLLANERGESLMAAAFDSAPGVRLPVHAAKDAAALGHLLDRLLNRKLPVDAAALAGIGGELAGGSGRGGDDRDLNWYGRPLVGFTKQVEYAAADGRTTPALRDAVRELLGRGMDFLGDERYLNRLRDALASDEPAGEAAPFAPDPGEPWADQLAADLAASSAAGLKAWNALLRHCATANAPKPGAKWLKAAGPLRAAVGDSFAEAVTRWFPLFEKPRTDQPQTRREPWLTAHPWIVSDRNINLLKGLVWCCVLTEDRGITRALTRLSLAGYKKAPGVGGPRSTKLGNACVWSLGHMPGTDAVGQLAMLAVKVKFGTAQKQIDKALTAAADREGLPRDEIGELAVPTYGLTDVGTREETLGDFTARIAVAGTGSAKLSFIDAKGKERKTVPAAVKRDFPDELKELKAAAKDIQKMLPAQRDRIDSLFLAQKSWPLATWRERYWDHPLVGTLARRLIWRFGSGSSPQADGSAVAVNDSQIVDADGNPIDVPDDATVSLWHPIEEPEAAVLAWRRFYEDRGIAQPFKQAHREIYVLTDAERNTRTYSNRFAAQLVKQHQFKALGDVRGWRSPLRLMVDDGYPPPSKSLPAFGLRAEYWVEGAGDEYGRDATDSGAFLHLATDQIRFYPIDAATMFAHAAGGGYGRGWNQTRDPEPVPLEEVPPLALSEVLRDADLFVGVAGVGNDPTWADGASVGENRYDRWLDYSFGDLSATAATRRGVLSRLVPRLKIADRCEVGDKFLTVRGEFRTYKIHLGSGNILMEPNDQYLCIVPKANFGKDAADVALPFEGDRTLSVILSEAFLLADDLKITDPTIVSQIKR